MRKAGEEELKMNGIANYNIFVRCYLHTLTEDIHSNPVQLSLARNICIGFKETSKDLLTVSGRMESGQCQYYSVSKQDVPVGDYAILSGQYQAQRR